MLASLFAVFPQRAAAQEGSGPSPGSQLFVNLGLVLALILVNFLFSMAETALISVRRSRIEQLVEEGNRRAKIVHGLLQDPTRMLATVQVGVTLIGLFTGGAAAESAVGPFAAFVRNAAPGTLLAQYAKPVAFFSVLFAVTLLTLIVGEITPKSIAVRHAEAIALWAAYPVRFIQSALTPVVSVVTSASNVLVRPFGGKASFHETALSEDELRLLVEQSEEHGVIEPEEKEMIHSIFSFGETRVHNVMTPRLDISAVEADTDVSEASRAFTDSGHSRLPVYDDNLDNIVGVVHAKDVLRAIADSLNGTAPAEPLTLRALMREPYFIPDTKRVDDLLREFRLAKKHLAVVKDEYGTVTGIVTIEDLVEEIVGEIQDEYDAEEPVIHQVDENTCVIDAKLSLEDFNERMGVELPNDESGSLGGFVFALLGHQPDAGETAAWDGLRFVVEETDGKRINKVRVIRLEETLGAEPEKEKSVL